MGSNLKNAVIALLVPLPSVFFYLSLLHHYHTSISEDTALSPLWAWCAYHPLLLANILFFFNVNVLFWLISHIQSSHWVGSLLHSFLLLWISSLYLFFFSWTQMIDLYWTVIPILLVYYYATYPFAQYNWQRSRIVITLTWVWSLRLTHNYFRREKWQWGAREDWRFTNMRGQYGKHWWWISFFSVYFSQQVIYLCFYLLVMLMLAAVYLLNFEVDNA